MLLLYLNCEKYDSANYSIYIPLCFYFIELSEQRGADVIKFTFHYASTLSIRREKEALGITPIYIPLCFYFIFSQSAGISVSYPIYIPLCFYFITKENHQFRMECYIYIPLCFYFISGVPVIPIHLVQIYIPLCFYFIVVAICSLIGTLDLHSTMLLLYPDPAARVPTAVFIYIPLCFYFIKTGRCRTGKRIFIYIPLCFYFIIQGNVVHVCENNLHSTMLLLYPLLPKAPLFPDLYLHSTMLLLYRTEACAALNELTLFTFHYASTLSVSLLRSAYLPE